MKNPFGKIITDENYAQIKKRYDAFWRGEVADRPPVCVTFWNPKKDAVSPPAKAYATHKERWMDVKQRAAEANFYIENTEYCADALPTFFPNLGPEIFSAICGCDYYFGPETTWSSPCIIDWERDADKATVNRNSEYFIAVDEFTRELLKYSKDKFAVGFTDFHAGADHLAALRDPAALCMDLIDNPGYVKEKLKASYEEYFKMYDYFYSLLTLEGMPTTSWIWLAAEDRYNVVQNDFSCMISSKMFEDFFLEGLMEECRRLDKAIYHLDGPNALRHLDMLLEIKNLPAIQWECGTGNEGFERWLPVYKKIQKAKKGMFLLPDISELDSIITNLKPDGIWFSRISGIRNKEDADMVIKRIAEWK